MSRGIDMQSVRPEKDSKIRFRYLAEHDWGVAYVDWQVESMRDVQEWRAAYEDYFIRNHRGRLVDVIFDLSKFTVSPRIASLFGEARAKMLKEFTGRTYRVRVDAATRIAMYTSRVLYGAPANEFESIEAAIAQLKADRAARTG